MDKRVKKVIRVREIDDLEILNCPACMGSKKKYCKQCKGTGEVVVRAVKYYEI